MLCERKVIEKVMMKKFIKYALDNNAANELYEICKEKYNIKKEETANCISTRIPIESLNTFMLFALMDCMEICEDIKNSELNKYFTEKEIIEFRKIKMELNETDFPLVFKMIQIADDQWIGKITVRELMAFMKKGIIRYNPDTQRAMKTITVNGEESWAISINKNAVKEINEKFNNREFIPNTITLNIPLDDLSADFSYNENKSQLIINNLQTFDITDGYHRVIGMQISSAKDIDFDYSMELRITNFSVEKASNFIHQEDKKTHMTKIESRAFNTNDPANIITAKLGESMVSNLNGLIKKYNGQISFYDLAALISRYYFPNKEKGVNVKILTMEVFQILLQWFNMLTDLYPELLKQKLNFIHLGVIIDSIDTYNNEDKKEYCKKIKQMLDYVSTKKISDFNISTSRFSKNKLKSVIKNIKEVCYIV